MLRALLILATLGAALPLRADLFDDQRQYEVEQLRAREAQSNAEKLATLREIATAIANANGGSSAAKEWGYGQSISFIDITLANGYQCQIDFRIEPDGKRGYRQSRGLDRFYCTDGRERFTTDKRGRVVRLETERHRR